MGIFFRAPINGQKIQLGNWGYTLYDIYIYIYEFNSGEGYTLYIEISI